MKKELQNTIKIIILGLIVSGGISYVYAWTAPATTPPSLNVAAPINVSLTSQTKTGVLSAGGLISSAGANIATTLGVGAGSSPVSSGLTLDVEGKVGATQYCDNNGTGCTTTPGVPTGAVMAFNLSACPTGWVASTGANGTADLRGYFVRGLDTRSTGSVDPDAPRLLASSQVEMYKSHTHTQVAHNHPNAILFAPGFVTAGAGNDINLKSGSSAVATPIINASGGAETRPDNVALLYCQKS